MGALVRCALLPALTLFVLSLNIVEVSKSGEWKLHDNLFKRCGTFYFGYQEQ